MCFLRKKFLPQVYLVYKLLKGCFDFLMYM